MTRSHVTSWSELPKSDPPTAVGVKSNRVARKLALLTSGAAGAAGLYVFNPDTEHVPLCPLHAGTGLWCPFCGTTRAAHALLHGNVMQAVHDNLLFVMALPLLCAALFGWLAANQSPLVLANRVPRELRWPAIAVLLAFAVLRNTALGAALAPQS